MKISVICFSLTGYATGSRLTEGFIKLGHQAELFKKSRYLEDSIKESTEQWTGKQFACADAIVFVGACGIAVRSAAPWVKSKKTDPAIVVSDECGHYVIALLSGHLGGANELAKEAAKILDAVPVITTATDLHSRFAVDVFAKKNGCAIFYMDAAKEVSAAILAGEPVGFYSEYLWVGEFPRGLVLCGPDGKVLSGERFCPRTGVAVTIHKDCMPFEKTVHVVPKTAVLGMGCRKNKEKQALLEEAQSLLQRTHIYPEAISKLASIDIKKNEPGLVALAEKFGIPFLTFSKEELLEAEGEFTSSSFVKEITGVDSVCERSAVLASESGTLIEKKHARDGMTTAMAVTDWRIHFE